MILYVILCIECSFICVLRNNLNELFLANQKCFLLVSHFEYLGLLIERDFLCVVEVSKMEKARKRAKIAHSTIHNKSKFTLLMQVPGLAVNDS